MFFVYHQHAVQHLNISIYHLATKITRWQSTYYSTQLTITQWTFHNWSSGYGNIWRTIRTRPSSINWLTSHNSVWLSRGVSRWSSTHFGTIFLHSNLHNGYRITETCRTRDILLLLFLVPTSHLSMPTFLIRFFVTYYCGWWCKGSTHLQK